MEAPGTGSGGQASSAAARAAAVIGRRRRHATALPALPPGPAAPSFLEPSTKSAMSGGRRAAAMKAQKEGRWRACSGKAPRMAGRAPPR